MNRSESLKIAASYLPLNVRSVLENLSGDGISEVRLRTGRPISLVRNGKMSYIDKNGKILNICSGDCITVSAGEIRTIVEKLCHYSVHSSSEQLRSGCFVIENGIRVGIAGRFSNSSTQQLNEFYGLNFRLPMQVKGCADIIFDSIYPLKKSVVICGTVNSGKTTMLRDLARRLGNVCKTVVIDERNEIFASFNGKPTFEPGLNSDIISCISRSQGITMAMRVLSPDYILCDEIATDSDVSAILSAHGSGIKFAATIHADGYENLLARPISQELLRAGVFDTAVILEQTKIKEIRSIGHD